MNSCSDIHLTRSRAAALAAALLPAASVDALAETFKVLGDSTRVRLLDALARAELCVCDLARLVGMQASAVSHQLRILRGMRLVRQRRDGRRIFYALDDQHILALFNQGLEHVVERGPRPPAPSVPVRWPRAGARPDRGASTERRPSPARGARRPARRARPSRAR